MSEPLDLPWEWKYADEAGVGVPGPKMAFDSQQAAEAWLSENFAELADAGITAVNLFDGQRVVYGPMPLAPAD